MGRQDKASFPEETHYLIKRHSPALFFETFNQIINNQSDNTRLYIMENRFDRVRSAKDIAISLILFAAGIACIVVPGSVPVNIVGYTSAIAGLILFFVMKTAFKDTETGEKLKKTEKYFPASKSESILKALSTDPQDIDLNEENKGNGLKVDTYYNTSTGHVFIQLFEYIPYKYEPCSPVYSYDISKAQKLIK